MKTSIIYDCSADSNAIRSFIQIEWMGELRERMVG